MGLEAKSSSFLAIISEISTMPMLNKLFAISMVASKRCGLLYTCNMILSREDEDLLSSSLFRGDREKNATSDAAIKADKQRRITVHTNAKSKLILNYTCINLQEKQKEIIQIICLISCKYG